jgi:hypothetical protein
MTVKTYGEHCENAARALNRLIRADTIPLRPRARARARASKRDVAVAMEAVLMLDGAG